MSELRIENDDQKKVVPSAIYNNLSHVDGLRVFAYKKEAVLLKGQSVRLLSLDARSSSRKRQTVTHVGAGMVEGKAVATVTAGDSMELWDLGKEQLISSTQVTTQADVVAQTTAIGNNNGASFAATGASNGDVAVYSINGELQTTPLARQGAHRAAVNAIGVSPNPSSQLLFASGDAEGTVILWSRTMAPAVTIPPPQAAGDCVTSIVSDGTYFVVAYGGGKIRLYSAANGALTVEVAAHARWLNAAAIQPASHHLATCGDDGTVYVWQLPTADAPQMKLLGQKFMKNYLWTGLAFGAEGSRTLYASSYDVDRSYTFSY